MYRRYIKFKFQKEGIHRYPAAATDPKLKEVAFLAHPHRHMFWFYVTAEVAHNDRDIEFIIAKRWAESQYDTKAMEVDYKSCEMLAEELLRAIKARFGDRYYKVEVYEDDENGGVVEYFPKGEDGK